MASQTETKWWTLGVVSVATFMLLLDITVVNVALPSIEDDLDATFTDLQWVVDDLEQLGYVERAQDPQDGRAKVIKLTAQGAEAHSTALEIFADIERDWGERYGAERVATMRALLEELATG